MFKRSFCDDIRFYADRLPLHAAYDDRPLLAPASHRRSSSGRPPHRRPSHRPRGAFPAASWPLQSAAPSPDPSLSSSDGPHDPGAGSGHSPASHRRPPYRRPPHRRPSHRRPPHRARASSPPYEGDGKRCRKQLLMFHRRIAGIRSRKIGGLAVAGFFDFVNIISIAPGLFRRYNFPRLNHGPCTSADRPLRRRPGFSGKA